MSNLVFINALYQEIYQALLPAIVEKNECSALVKRLLYHYFDCDLNALVFNKKVMYTTAIQKKIQNSIHRLQNHEPLQYVLQEAFFLGEKIMVNPAVLIPRPETEEMVHYIIKNNKKTGLQVLDIATGSGCIAILLKKMLKKGIVHALDIDENALLTAKKNAQKLNVNIQWITADILDKAFFLPTTYDLIVSNPPYVRISEQKWMHQRVLKYEPHHALFVPDEMPLLFYQRIIAIAKERLKQYGKIYLEINEAFGRSIIALLEAHCFINIQLHKDFQNKNRWIEAEQCISE